MKRVLSLILSVLMVVSVFTFGSFSVSAENATLIAKGSEWKYWVAAEIDAELPEGWTAADFDASAWKSGKAIFGNGFEDRRVTDVDGQQLIFIKDFSIASLENAQSLSIELIYDQDPVIYINGTKVFERTGYSADYATIDLSEHASVLKEGMNRITVYMDNTNDVADGKNNGGFGYGVAFDMSMTVVADTVVVMPVETSFDLIARDAEWKHYDVLSDESDAAKITLPEGWYNVGFDTTGWLTDKAPFTGVDYKNHNANTTIDQEGKHVVSAFVKTFTIDDIEAFNKVDMLFRYDQDPVVYLNGTQIFSANYWNDNPTTVNLNYYLFSGLLKEGENTLAVYMHNPAGGGGYHMDLQLVATKMNGVDVYGNVQLQTATGTHGYGGDLGFGGALKVLDGDQGSTYGAGFTKDMYVQTLFYNYAEVTEITVRRKNEGIMTESDGKTAGYYDIYVGSELVAAHVPAWANEGCTVKLDTPVLGKSVKVVITEWTATDCWAGVADVFVKGNYVEEKIEAKEIEITKWGTGWENWSGATQLLIYAESGLDDYLWNVTIADGEDSATISMKPTSVYHNGAKTIYRFETCNGAEDNKFIPTKGTDYTITVALENADGDITHKSAPTSGYVCGMDPIPTKLTVRDHFGGIENNWDKTYFLVGVTPATGANQAMYDKLSAGEYTMKVTLTDEDTGKVYVIPEYAFDSGYDFYGDFMIRMAFCDYGIEIVAGHKYTIGVTIYDGDQAIYAGTSQEGLFCNGNDDYNNNGAIIPEEIPHSYVDLDVAFEGYQVSNDGTSIRFIGSINDVAFENVDLTITVEGRDKIYTNVTTKVFTSLKSADGIAATVADSGVEAPVVIDADYLFGYAITGIPAGTYTFTIVPTATNALGVVVTGEAVTTTITVG